MATPPIPKVKRTLLVVGEELSFPESVQFEVHAVPAIGAHAAASVVAPDLILLRGEAADEGGLSVLTELRKDPRTACIPVALLTDDALADEHRHGAIAVMEENTDASVLAGHIRHVLRRRPRQRGLAAFELENASYLHVLVEQVRGGVHDGVLSTGGKLSVEESGIAEGDGTGARVLLLSDDAMGGERLARHLRDAGMLVAVAGDKAGLMQARNMGVQVAVWSDEDLADGGVELLREIRADRQLRWSSLLVAAHDFVRDDAAQVGAHVAHLVATDRELRKLAEAGDGFSTRIEALGPERLLRAVASAEAIRLTCRTRHGVHEIDVGGGMVRRARAELGRGTQLDGSSALASFLTLGSGRVRVERPEALASGFIGPVDQAMASAHTEKPPILTSRPPPPPVPSRRPPAPPPLPPPAPEPEVEVEVEMAAQQPAVVEPEPPLGISAEEGETVEGYVLEQELFKGAASVLYRATHGEDIVTVEALRADADDAQRAAFEASGRVFARIPEDEELEGIAVPTGAVADGTIRILPIQSVGTVIDLPALRWKLEHRVGLVQEIAEALRPLHVAGVSHGSLSPSLILLDDDFGPWVTGAAGTDVPAAIANDRQDVAGYARYAAPEIKAGQQATVQSDIYGLGRLLHFLLLSAEPEVTQEPLPRLEDLAQSPAGLVRIVRRCTVADPTQRYDSVDAFIADLLHYGFHDKVGLAHASVKEHNVTGISASLFPRRIQRSAAPPPRKRKPAKRPEPKRQKTRRGEPAADFPQGVRRALAAIGALAVVFAIVMPFLQPATDSIATTIGAAFAFGVGALTLLAPAAPPRPRFSRLAFFAAAVSILWALDPLAPVADIGAANALSSGQAGDRAEAVKALIQRGKREFAGIDLSGASLQRVDLSYADLKDANLSGTDLSWSDLTMASLQGANLEDANLTGAILVDVELSASTELVGARCDLWTSLPNGFGCHQDHVRVEDVAVQPSGQRRRGQRRRERGER